MLHQQAVQRDHAPGPLRPRRTVHQHRLARSHSLDHRPHGGRVGHHVARSVGNQHVLPTFDAQPGNRRPLGLLVGEFPRVDRCIVGQVDHQANLPVAQHAFNQVPGNLPAAIHLARLHHPKSLG